MQLYQLRLANRRLATARLAALGGAMQGAGKSLSDASAASGSTGAAAPIYGFTKVCHYQTATGPRALTIGSAEICPLTIPYP